MSKIGGPSMSLVENNVSASSAAVGHYKGVMLCNRPFGGTVVTQKSSQSESKAVFTAGVVSAPVGVCAPIASKDKQLKRPNKDSVLVKHKKWLAELQKTKERLEVQYIDDLRKKEEDKQRFQETERKMREVSRTVLKPDVNADSKDEKASSMASNLTEKATSKDSYASAKRRPAWALNEADATQQNDSKQQAEEDELLEFAQGLDYEKFIDDLEVRVMVEKLRERISALEKDVEDEKDRETDAETRAARREMLTLMNNTQDALLLAEREKAFNRPDNGVDNAALGAARALLDDEDADIQNVHSTKSVVQLLKNAKDKIQTVQGAARPPQTPAEPKVTNEPKVVIHEPNEGARLEEKKSVSKLPYMHRNPAV